MIEDRIVKIIEWLQSPSGQITSRILAVFLLAELARVFTYKVMGLVDLGKKKESILVDLAGFTVNIMVGVLFTILFKGNNSWGVAIIWGSFYMGGALIIHMIYAYKIEPWIKKKAANKSK